MFSVFISYAWKDRDVAEGIIVPFLRSQKIEYFIDHENFDLRVPDDSTLQASQYVAQAALKRLADTSALELWQERVPYGKPVSWLALEIERAITKHEIHLVLMSRAASRSFWVNREIDFSLSLGRKVLVLHLDNALLPDRLGMLVNAGVIPSVRFTGEARKTGISSWSEYVTDLQSKDSDRREAAVRAALATSGVVHRQATSDDLAQLELSLRRLAAVPGFDPGSIVVTEKEFTLSDSSFRFVSLAGSPYVRRFALLKYPLTRRQYALFDPTWEKYDFTDCSTPEAGDKNEQPATQMSWNEARDYCRWLSDQTGHQLRLPYEVEWEMACRAGSSARYCFGDAPALLPEYAVFDVPHNAVVGERKPNVWGLYDMHGNVGEWCGDVLDVGESHGIQSARTAGAIRVIRGGAGFREAHSCTSGFRYFDTAESRASSRGFRLCWPG